MSRPLLSLSDYLEIQKKVREETPPHLRELARDTVLRTVELLRLKGYVRTDDQDGQS